MPSKLQSFGIDQLSVDGRLDLVAEIWDDLAADPSRIPLINPQQEELDRRLAECDAAPGAVVAWSSVKTDAEARLQK